MEFAISIQIEELPEGVWLATSDELSGLVAQGRTAAEALDIECDVARNLIGGSPRGLSVSRRRSEAQVLRIPV